MYILLSIVVLSYISLYYDYLFLLILLPPVLFYIIYYYNYYRYFRGIPSKQAIFPFGDLYNITSHTNDTFAKDLQQIARELEDPHVFLFHTGPKPWIMINSPEALQELLVSKSVHFKKGEMFDGIRKFVGRTLLVLEEKDGWLHHKKMIDPLFKTTSIKQVYESVFIPHADNLVNKWYSLLTDDRDGRGNMTAVIDIQSECSSFAFSILSEAVFGKKVISSNVDLSYVLNNVIYAGLPGADRIPYYHSSLRNMTSSLYQDVEKEKEINQFNLRKLLLEGNLSPEEVNEECVGFILAGFETTASLLTWIIITLAQKSNKEVLEKVQDEIDIILKQGNVNVTWEKINPLSTPGLPYLASVITECARLYPPAQFVNRTSLIDTTIQDYFIPKNTTVWYSPYLINRNAKVYSEPDKFDPERFYNKRGPSSLIWATFGTGSRSCIGKNFALAEITTVLIKILSNFSLELLDSDITPSRFSPALKPKNDKLRVMIKKRF